MRFYYTYVLKSSLDDKYYIGWTHNLRKRYKKHNLGKIRVTKNRLPFNLVYFEACLSKEKAILREKQLKSGFGRSYLKRTL
ncbi:MAG TPA: GIY-YIG nuclease family protein [Candidatus Bathyarchaeia archaeon]|nr:GIY-YIG nuclease family protein [Candidatus Bathyarchaeia archaeon]